MIANIFSRVLRLYLRMVLSPLSLATRQGVRIGRNSMIGAGVNFGSEPYLISIGDNFYSSSNVQFITHDGSVNVFRNLYAEYKNADLFSPIAVGNNVFLGFGVTILPGTIIEDNVIVGANSLVKGRLIRDSVYAGSPARLICSIDDYLEKNKSRILFTKNLRSDEKKNVIQRHFDVAN